MTGTKGMYSNIASPRSGLATPTASGPVAAAAVVSPGSFFGGSSLVNAARMGSIGGGLNDSLSLMGVGAASLGPASMANAGMASTMTSANLSGTLSVAPATPKRVMSGQRLSELVHHPMAAAAAAATGTMAEQERESFSQLAAEASGVASGGTSMVNGTPYDGTTPAASLGVGGLSAQQSLNSNLPAVSDVGPVVAGPGGLRLSIGGLSYWILTHTVTCIYIAMTKVTASLVVTLPNLACVIFNC